ncbi:MAG: cobalamin biosynthesis protein CobW, partial [Ruminococcaceae bacterium]|nr:cobalamin biosynthesis protein CobW [Oscillospiraceae bacterium]
KEHEQHHEHGEHCCCGHDHEEHEHHHEHGEHCCCGHDHEKHEHHHEHGEHCCCGHDHEEHEHHHEHGEHCCCGHDHEEHEHHHEHGEHCCCGHDHEEHQHHHEHGEHCNCGHHSHHADEVFTSFGVETTKKFTQDAIQSILDSFDEDSDYGMVLRAKGIVAGDDGKWIHFDYVPGEPDVRLGTAGIIGRLCVIGSGLNNDKIKELFGV